MNFDVLSLILRKEQWFVNVLVEIIVKHTICRITIFLLDCSINIKIIYDI